jgi:hypothetical protein
LQASGEVPRQELLDTVDGMIGDVRQHMPQISSPPSVRPKPTQAMWTLPSY